MASLVFPWALVGEFIECKHQVEELWLKEACKNNVKLVEEKLKLIKWKKAALEEYCNDELSEDVSDDEIREFHRLYIKKLSEIKNFINKAEEWTRLCKQSAVKKQSFSSYDPSTQRRTGSLKSSMAYAKIKLAEKRAKYEAEKVNRKILLDLRKSERQIEDQIEELKFQQKGRELRNLEIKLKHTKKERPSSRGLKSSELLQQKVVTLHRTELTEEKDVNKDQEVFRTHYQFGCIEIGSTTYRKNKIKEKCFYIKKEVKFVKGKIDCLYDMNFVYNYIKENHFPIICEIHVELHSTICQNRIEFTKDATNSTLKNCNKAASITTTVNRKEKKAAITTAYKKIEIEGNVLQEAFNPLIEADNTHKVLDLLAEINLGHQQELEICGRSSINEIADGTDNFRNTDLLGLASSGFDNNLDCTLSWNDILSTEIEVTWILWLDIFTLKNYKYRRR